MRMTMKQIAELAGVHRSTVDKVIHNRPGVSEPVRERIRAMIEEYGYQPNEAGIALRMQEKTFRIAVLLMEADAADYILSGIRQAAGEYGAYNVQWDCRVLKTGEVPGMPSLLLELERSAGADGVILMPHRSETLRDAVRTLRTAGIPVVLVNADLPESGALCYIGADNRRSSRLAAHLMGGFTGGTGQIAVVTSSLTEESSNSAVVERVQSFRELLAADFPGLTIVETVENLENPELTYQRTRELLGRFPALRGIYNASAGGSRVGQAAEELGRSLTIITHELYPETVELIRRGVILCSIGSELTNQGRLAARTLMEYLILKKEPEREKIYTRSEAFLRENAEAVEP